MAARFGQVTTVEGAESFEEFYVADYARVVRLAVAMTGRRDLAEELAQESFVAAYRRWSRVVALDDPGAWVRRVLVNKCVSSGRRHVTELRMLARLGQEPSPAASGDGTGGDELWAVVRSLPRRQAQVLFLSFVEDRSVRDIAGVLGCGEETVRTHLRRGRTAVAELLRVEPRNEQESDCHG